MTRIVGALTVMIITITASIEMITKSITITVIKWITIAITILTKITMITAITITITISCLLK